MEPLLYHYMVCEVFFTKRILVQCVSELSTSLELGNLLSCNLDFSFRGGVDAFTSGTLVDAERAEAHQSYFVACDEGVFHCYYGCIKSLLCVNL